MARVSIDIPDPYATPVGLTVAERCELLAAERRRLALDVIADRTGPLELADLAAAVARREDGLDAADADDRRRVRTSLHHRHLPMMDDLGLVEYDPDANLVEPHH